MNARAVAITGLGIAAPGLGRAADLLSDDPLDGDRTCDPASILGRKGLAYKDEATRLALCAVHSALADAGLPPARLSDGASTGVVVSSNLGNLDTVCRVVDTVHAGSTGDLSPMDVPNASSNVIASTIAIRYGCRAINLTLCCGATSGIDAVIAAARALRAGRAERMIVAGVEPGTDAVRRLADASVAVERGREPVRLGCGASAVVLEPAEDARARRARVRGTIEGYDEAGDGAALAATLRAGDLWLMPNQAWPCARALAERLGCALAPGVETRDVCRAVGDLYGALGVFQCAAACVWIADGGRASRPTRVLATAGASWGDGVASLLMGAEAG